MKTFNNFHLQIFALFGQYWKTQITKNTKNCYPWSFLLALSAFKLGCSWEGRKTLFFSSKEKKLFPTFFFLQKKNSSYHFSFLQKELFPTIFLFFKRKGAQLPIFFSRQGIRVSRYKSANICELWVASCVAFS